MRLPWPPRQRDFHGGGGYQATQTTSSEDRSEGQADAKGSTESVHQENPQVQCPVEKSSVQCPVGRGRGVHLLRRASVLCPAVWARSGHGAHHQQHHHPGHLKPEVPAVHGCSHSMNELSVVRHEDIHRQGCVR